MTFYVGKTQVRFTFGFFALAAFFLLIDREGIGLAVLGAALLHEAGHGVALYCGGGRAKSVTFHIYGIGLSPAGMLSYTQEAALLLGGVEANLLGLCCTVWLTGERNDFFYANAAMMVFHLLPVSVLDGGRLLRLALDASGDMAKSAAVTRLITLLILLPLLALGIVMALQKNPTLLLTGLYLWITTQNSS